jgi:hypothetical protein
MASSTASNVSPKTFDRLDNVVSKKDEWAALPISEKVELLKAMLYKFQEQGFGAYKALGESAATMMGIPIATDEGRLESHTQTLYFLSTIKAELESLLQVFRIRNWEKAPRKLVDLKMRKAINGQICVETFPLTPSDSPSIASSFSGEVWMDAKEVQNECDVKPFAFDQFESGGVLVVLGAGNHGFLGVIDALQGLFVRNCVVYFKIHPLQAYTHAMIQVLFLPLIERGFFATELHSSVDRAESLVNHPSVTDVHLTGGKASHDAIVWESNSKEQASNIQKGTPKLKATMTSELGDVSPWIVVPGEYSEKELQTQAKLAALFMHSNASCNCNAPKVFCVSDSWKQKKAFLEIAESSLREHTLPVAWYPGTRHRWETFRKAYPTATEIHSQSGLGIKERQLVSPLGGNEPCLLPFLKICTVVDLSTEKGQQAAKKEYAFNNEPFSPVYTIATLEHTHTLDSFCKTAATFCNNYLFGSLSGSVTVSPLIESSVEFQNMIASLRYGSLSINAWAGFCYGPTVGGWGAFPGESLDKVVSGIGRVHNLLFLPHFEKFVLRAPICSSIHGSLNLKKASVEARVIEAVGYFTFSPGIISMIGIFSALIGVDLVKVCILLVCLALIVALGYMAPLSKVRSLLQIHPHLFYT